MKRFVKTVSLLAAAVLCLSLSGCVTKKSYCVKSGDHSISAGMYAYQLAQQKSSYLSQNSLTEGDETWDEEYDDTLTIGEYIQSATVNSLVSSLVWRLQFDRLGLSFTEEEQKNIEENIAEMEEGSGGKEMVKQTLDEYGISYDEFIESVYYDTQKILKVVDYYFGENGVEPVPESEILEYFTDNYTRCKHILISTQDANGNTLTDNDMKEAKSKAQSVYEKAKNADEAAFDQLIEEYNEDEGVASYPDGYVFTTGEMVDAFEKAAFDMEVGETRLIQSEYGFHIIRKLTLEDESVFTEEIRKNMLMSLKNGEISEMFTQWQEEFSIKINRGVLTKYTCKTVSIGEDVSAGEEEQLAQIADQLGLEEIEQ